MTGGVAEVVECLPSKCNAMSSKEGGGEIGEEGRKEGRSSCNHLSFDEEK
jgi:hypothetical protein